MKVVCYMKLYNFGFGQKFLELCFRNYFQSIFAQNLKDIQKL